MPKDFTVTIIQNSPRAPEWEKILGPGIDTVHVKSPFPTRANLPGHPNTLIYELDLNLITDKQRQRLIAHIAHRFDIPPEEVQRELPTHGVPILAEDCVATITNPQRYF